MSVVVSAPSARDPRVRRAGIALGIVAVGVILGRVAAYDQTLLLGATLALLWGALFVGVFRRVVLARISSPVLRRLIVAGLAFRVPIVIAHLVIGMWVMGGAVDFRSYFGNVERRGADLFTGEFLNWTIGTERDIGGVLTTYIFVPIYVFLGPSLLGMFVWSSLIGFMGAFLFLRAFQIQFGDERDAAFLARCLFFYPSVAFWSSLLGKDSLMFFFLGLSTYGLMRFLAKPGLGTAIALALGTGAVLLIRPPIGAALAVAAVGAALIASRAWITYLRGPVAILRPVIFIVLTTFIAVGSYSTVLGPLKRYGVYGESASPIQGLLTLAVERHVGLSTDPHASGSSLQIRIYEPTAAEALRFLPEALLTFLFRPHIFEAHNALALAAALDGVVLMCLIVFRWRHLLASFHLVWTRPLVLFAVLAFTLCSAGLAFESNFGAIVRHRIMVFPFLFMLLALPRHARRRPSGGPS